MNAPSVKEVQNAIAVLCRWVNQDGCPVWAQEMVIKMLDVIEQVLVNREVK